MILILIRIIFLVGGGVLLTKKLFLMIQSFDKLFDLSLQLLDLYITKVTMIIFTIRSSTAVASH